MSIQSTPNSIELEFTRTKPKEIQRAQRRKPVAQLRQVHTHETHNREKPKVCLFACIRRAVVWGCNSAMSNGLPFLILTLSPSSLYLSSVMEELLPVHSLWLHNTATKTVMVAMTTRTRTTATKRRRSTEASLVRTAAALLALFGPMTSHEGIPRIPAFPEIQTNVSLQFVEWGMLSTGIHENLAMPGFFASSRLLFCSLHCLAHSRSHILTASDKPPFLFLFLGCPSCLRHLPHPLWSSTDPTDGYPLDHLPLSTQLCHRHKYKLTHTHKPNNHVFEKNQQG